MKLVEVFKSSRREETYLYLEHGADFDTLPEALRQVFGQPEFVLSMSLTPERQLARLSGAEVLEALEQVGFVLQMPNQLEALDLC